MTESITKDEQKFYQKNTSFKMSQKYVLKSKLSLVCMALLTLSEYIDAQL